MDPTNNRGPEEHGRDDDVRTPRQRPPRDPLTQALAPGNGQNTPALARTVQLVSGDYLLTVNPVDGSEIELCPPGERPGRPVKFTPAERAELARASRPPVPPGPSLPRMPLLEREEERERLVRLLARGRSVRLTGPSGSGRTALLEAVADDCADLAPDGVVRLSGYRRTVGDLLHHLFAAVYSAPLYRPEPDELLALVREIGAVVVLDDIEFGGGALDELLDATPECAFLISATPEVAAPSTDSLLEEVFLGGLGRAGGLELLERAVGRVLTEDEANWAGDLWFESEGRPLRFVQAGALLRQRDQLRADPNAFDEYGYYEDAPVDAPFDAEDLQDVPLPSLADGAAPAALLASRLSESARATLRFAVALGGEVPHQAHLPALVGDTHADAALAELVGCALVTPVGSHYRLAAGVHTQLAGDGYVSDAHERAQTAARHYAWWAGHPSVTPERVAAEADAVLAALTGLVSVAEPPLEGEEESAAVALARAVAPAFAASLDWGSWERTLRAGAEVARVAGEVSEQAYFHHELGILALCGGQYDRSRAELEASVGLRGAVADKRGSTAGRRALALVDDRTGVTPAAGFGATTGEEVSDARYEESASPPGGVPATFASVSPPTPPQLATVITRRTGPPASHRPSGVKRLVNGTKRNLVAAGAGAMLVAVLGTVVTLGATSDGENPPPSERVGVNPSASPGDNGGGLGAEQPVKDDDSDSTSRPTAPDPGEDGIVGTADDPTPTPSKKPSEDDPTGTKDPDDPTKSPSKPPTSKPPADDPTPKPPDDPTPTPPDDPTPTPPDDPTPTPPDDPTTPPTVDPPDDPTPPDNSASGPAPSTPVSSPPETTASAPAESDEPPGGDLTTVI
ncbi:ATP-binding protein [Streptomyces ureilyticus]|uniref:ATP-binding protein n=1 Tax=Streptomyces ureilyticus TaxID=1775131 RepID=A0ABX0DTN3_9ACTN|nr:ATP-binding protein [Streptomyces ureilyticus]NGO44045.1 ATP-binding protein [Streptomyces ureilyticus]